MGLGFGKGLPEEIMLNELIFKLTFENIYKTISTNDFKPTNIGHSIVKRLPKSLLKFNKNNFINKYG